MPEESILHIHHCENLKSYTDLMVTFQDMVQVVLQSGKAETQMTSAPHISSYPTACGLDE
jgi:hypothetical protein